MKPHERRVSTRKTLKHLSYVSLPSDNGGIVLDVSEGGLGFHSIVPVQAAGPIEFRLALGSAQRVTAIGEVVWRDSTGKTGGLRFIQLPNELRKQVRIWAGESDAGIEAAAAVPTKTNIVDVPDDIPVAAPGIAAEATAPLVAQRAGAVGVRAAGSVTSMALALMENVETMAPATAALTAFAAAAEAAPPRGSGPPAGKAILHAQPAAAAGSSPPRRTEKFADNSAGMAARARAAIAASTSKRSSAPVVNSGLPRGNESRVPAYGAQTGNLSIFGLDRNPKTKPSALPVPPPSSIQHPITAVVLTIALAFVVSIGLFSYLFKTRAGDALMHWGQAVWGVADPQEISQVPGPPASTQGSSSQSQ